jgi:Ca2+-binding RTX toxin-like protein
LVFHSEAEGNDDLTGGNGNDTFVFEADNGIDQILDFDLKNDTVDLSALGLAGLDSDGSGVLDDGDDFVTINGSDTTIDLGAAVGGEEGINTVTFVGVTSLSEGDFFF